MPTTDALGIRMKENYEKVSQTKLLRRTPVAIRIDGRSFHTWTRGFAKPFDEILIQAMQETAKYLCANIQGCVFGYTQSDEITLILQDYKELDTSAWFDYKVQKLCSVAASMATMTFNKIFTKVVREYKAYCRSSYMGQSMELQMKYNKYIETLTKAAERGAMFDARCFNIPKEEVCNLIYWRQLDATRNSIQMVAQSLFSHSELQGLSCNKLQDKMFTEKDINWNELNTYLKRGTAIVKQPEEGDDISTERWFIDKDMPILKGEDRNYVEQYI